VGRALVGDLLFQMESKLSIEMFLGEPSAEEALVPAHDSTSIQASDWPWDSFVPQRHNGIDLRRPPRGDITSDGRDGCFHGHCSTGRQRISVCDSVKLT
jgi:hypothetical protein